MNTQADRERHMPTKQTENANESVVNQPEGAARRPRDTLDRNPKRDPHSGGSIPTDYNAETMTRHGEENETRAGREGAGKR